jgi:hypothetical protein
MKRRLFASVIGIACAMPAFLAIPASTADGATPDCVYTPKLPAKIVVNQDVVGMKARLATAAAPGVDCRSNFSVSIHLVHSTDSYFLNWDDTGTATDNESVYAFEIVPGVYRTTSDGDCYAMSSDYETQYTCAVGADSTVIKFASHTKLTATRTKKAPKDVTFTVRTTRYAATGLQHQASRVAIQRYSHGKWHTVHTGTTKAKTGAYTWTHRYVKKAKYRAVAQQTRAAFGSTSKAIKR